MKSATSAVTLAASGLLLAFCPSLGLTQQRTGKPGSPGATTTTTGKQLPPPDPTFGGMIEEKASQSEPWCVACWLAGNDRGGRSPHGLSYGILVYNAGTLAVLALAALVLRVHAVALWPMIVPHALMTTWIVMTLRVPLGPRRMAGESAAPESSPS